MEKDKELLLKDLCARLPYGVVLDVDTTDWKAPQGHIQVKIEGVGLIFKDQSLIVNGSYYGDNYKPYLRPMSSMTEEEILELYKITYETWYCDSLYYRNEEWINFRNSIKNNNLCFKTCIWLSDINKVINWLLKNHFDFRGLIEKNLAIAAPKGMYDNCIIKGNSNERYNNR